MEIEFHQHSSRFIVSLDRFYDSNLLSNIYMHKTINKTWQASLVVLNTDRHSSSDLPFTFYLSFAWFTLGFILRGSSFVNSRTIRHSQKSRMLRWELISRLLADMIHLKAIENGQFLSDVILLKMHFQQHVWNVKLWRCMYAPG